MFDEDRIRALICWGMVLWLIFLGAVWMAGQGCDTRLQIYRQVMMKWSHSHWKVIGSSIRCCMPCKNSAYKHGQSNIKNILVKFPVKCSRPVCVRESFCCCCFFHITIQTRASVLMRDDFTPHYTWEKTVFWRREKKKPPPKKRFSHLTATNQHIAWGDIFKASCATMRDAFGFRKHSLYKWTY